ncbi:MAG: ABC transporter substrate-binding protein [Rhizobiaceae bacterium]
MEEMVSMEFSPRNPATKSREGRLRFPVKAGLASRLVAALLMGSALAMGCGAGAAPATAATTIRLNENAPGDTDPARSVRAIGSILFYNLYDTLLMPGPGGKGVVPHLAESYTADGNTYVFKLRHGVKFVSGNEMTSDDVVFSLNRLLAIGAGPAPLFKGWVDKTEAVDKYTVRITTKSPYAPFLTATFRLGIVDSKTVMANLQDGSFGEYKDYGQAYLALNSAGTGAYKIAKQAPQTQTILEKNPNYFLPIPAEAPDQVIFSYGVEPATQVALMNRGQLDIMSQWASPETKRSALKIKGVSIVGESGLTALQIKLNTAKAPLDDVHCRKALALAVDYDALVKQSNITSKIKGAAVTNGPLLEGMPGYDPSVPKFKRDMDGARKELAQCKYKPEDSELEISWLTVVPLEERFALLLQQNWSELGFKSKITAMPPSLYYQSVSKPETTPNVSQIFSTALTPDPDGYLSVSYGEASHGQQYAAEWLSDAEVDQLLQKGRETLDPAAREGIYKQLAARLRELQPTIWAYEAIQTYAKSDRVGAPALEDPAKNMHVTGMNFMFRMMAAKKGG